MILEIKANERLMKMLSLWRKSRESKEKTCRSCVCRFVDKTSRLESISGLVLIETSDKAFYLQDHRSNHDSNHAFVEQTALNRIISTDSLKIKVPIHQTWLNWFDSSRESSRDSSQRLLKTSVLWECFLLKVSPSGSYVCLHSHAYLIRERLDWQKVMKKNILSGSPSFTLFVRCLILYLILYGKTTSETCFVWSRDRLVLR